MVLVSQVWRQCSKVAVNLLFVRGEETGRVAVRLIEREIRKLYGILI
jgi:hypothetical protein